MVAVVAVVWCMALGPAFYEHLFAVVNVKLAQLNHVVDASLHLSYP